MVVRATAEKPRSPGRLQDDIGTFKAALRMSRHIGVALGIVMTTQRRWLDDAWQVVLKESQNRNTKVSVLAIALGAPGHILGPGTGPRRPSLPRATRGPALGPR